MTEPSMKRAKRSNGASAVNWSSCPIHAPWTREEVAAALALLSKATRGQETTFPTHLARPTFAALLMLGIVSSETPQTLRQLQEFVGKYVHLIPNRGGNWEHSVRNNLTKKQCFVNTPAKDLEAPVGAGMRKRGGCGAGTWDFDVSMPVPKDALRYYLYYFSIANQYGRLVPAQVCIDAIEASKVSPQDKCPRTPPPSCSPSAAPKKASKKTSSKKSARKQPKVEEGTDTGDYQHSSSDEDGDGDEEDNGSSSSSSSSPEHDQHITLPNTMYAHYRTPQSRAALTSGLLRQAAARQSGDSPSAPTGPGYTALKPEPLIAPAQSQHSTQGNSGSSSQSSPPLSAGSEISSTARVLFGLSAAAVNPKDLAPLPVCTDQFGRNDVLNSVRLPSPDYDAPSSTESAASTSSASFPPSNVFLPEKEEQEVESSAAFYIAYGDGYFETAQARCESNHLVASLSNFLGDPLSDSDTFATSSPFYPASTTARPKAKPLGRSYQKPARPVVAIQSHKNEGDAFLSMITESEPRSQQESTATRCASSSTGTFVPSSPRSTGSSPEEECDCDGDDMGDFTKDGPNPVFDTSSLMPNGDEHDLYCEPESDELFFRFGEQINNSMRCDSAISGTSCLGDSYLGGYEDDSTFF